MKPPDQTALGRSGTALPDRIVQLQKTAAIGHHFRCARAWGCGNCRFTEADQMCRELMQTLFSTISARLCPLKLQL